jgi:t-SNARE complex subunit (syntaxin)
MHDIDAMEDGILGGESDPLIMDVRVSKSQQIRQAGLQRIQKDMTTVNQLFRDLSGIVVSQGEMLRSVDANISRTVENSSKANDEVNKTYKREKERQALALRLAAFLFGFIVFIFISRRLLFGHW